MRPSFSHIISGTGTSEKGVRQHARLKHRISQQDGHCEENKPLDTSNKCGGCGKVLNNKDDIADHQNNVHPCMCYICFSFSLNMGAKVTQYKINLFKINGAF